MAVFLSPLFNLDSAQIDALGKPRNNHKLFTYLAGTTTKATTFRDSAGLVPHTNPIVLGSNGLPPALIYLSGGGAYKFVLAPPTDTDPPTSPLLPSIDNIVGIGDSSATASSEWIVFPGTPTFTGATTFTLLGDQTSIFHLGRRIRATTAGGTRFGDITTSIFTTLTTVTLLLDSGVLDAGLTVIAHGIISASDTSAPKKYSRQKFTANGTWTRPPGCRARLVRIVGSGGGGGASSAASGAGNASAGGGGSGGSYTEDFGIASNATEVVTIGAQAAGGVAPGGNGSNGAQSSFGSLITAPGGFGGAGSGASTAIQLLAAGGQSGALGSHPGVGYNMVGQPGSDSFHHAAQQVSSGAGGSTPFFYGGRRALLTSAGSVMGSGGGNFGGAGGAGGATLEFVDAAGGGHGAIGMCIVDEYY